MMHNFRELIMEHFFIQSRKRVILWDEDTENETEITKKKYPKGSNKQ